MPEWFVSSLMMDRALDAVLRRAKIPDRQTPLGHVARPRETRLSRLPLGQAQDLTDYGAAVERYDR